MKFELGHAEAMPDATKEEMAKVLLDRFGLLPRKKDGTAKFHDLLLELYEKKKVANREKKPEEAVMTVEEMGLYAGIKRQTMYDYLGRWLTLNLLKKTSFVKDGKKIIGYELNGGNLEGAFRKAETSVKNHLELSFKLIEELQSEVKKDKLRKEEEPSSMGGGPPARPPGPHVSEVIEPEKEEDDDEESEEEGPAEQPEEEPEEAAQEEAEVPETEEEPDSEEIADIDDKEEENKENLS